jgi:hypothetical protein
MDWRVCLDCGTEWDDADLSGTTCPDCGGPTVPTDPERAAAVRLYRDRKCDVAALLDWIELELAKHGEYAAKEGLTLAHGGDLGEMRRLLVEALAFLAQRDTDDIEEALADAAAGRNQAQDTD